MEKHADCVAPDQIGQQHRMVNMHALHIPHAVHTCMHAFFLDDGGGSGGGISGSTTTISVVSIAIIGPFSTGSAVGTCIIIYV